MDFNVATLAHDLTLFLAPLLPYLVKAGEGAAEEAGKKFTENTVELGKKLWAKLRPGVEANPVALATVQRALQQPDDQRIQPALEMQLEDLLQRDAPLAKELAEIWLAAKAEGNTVTQIGERNVTVIGNVQGGIKMGDTKA